MTVYQTEKKHCWFSPSAASRLIRCPGSRKASEGLSDKSSKDADAGTQCHSFMELYYSGQSIDANEFGFTETWQAEASDKACELTDQYMTDMIALHGQPVLNLEKTIRLPYGDILGVALGDVFGTIDVHMTFNQSQHLTVLDYKFGYNEVEAENNEQLLTYAVGALYENPDISTVDIVIVQPRTSPPLKVWKTTADAVRLWERTVLIPAVLEAAKDDSAIVPGEIQCKWCKVGRTRGCTAQAQPLIDLANSYEAATVNDFGSIEMDAEELARLATELPRFKEFLGHIESALIFRMKEGEQIPGFKLVHKGTHKKWRDEEEAEKYLARKGLNKEQRCKITLISPSAAYTALNMKKANTREKNAFEGHTVKPVGEVTFAPDSDPRPAVTPMEDMVAAAIEVLPHEEVEATPQAPEQLTDLSSLF